jgi:hypothetical protein
MQFRTALPLAAFDPACVQPGQWFRRANGTLAQYVGTRRTPSGAIVPHFCDTQQGETFIARTQRFARARWHLVHRHLGLETLVKRAPASVDDARLGAYARAATK